MGDIPKGLCQCGCGSRTQIAKMTNRKLGHKKGEPIRFVNGHHTNGANNPRWNGGCTVDVRGHLLVSAHGHPRAQSNGYVHEYILVAEKALGKPLPPKAVVHHHTPKQLVVCQDQAYHLLIHQRKRAYEACGHANWRKCVHCKEYDDPNNLDIYGLSIRHRRCERTYQNNRRKANG